MKKKIVILTGAEISMESGIATFRDANGLWEKYDPMKVAHINGWKEDRGLVLEFYNKRRSQLPDVQPNDGHKELVRLEEKFDVVILTTNVDDLHERANSKNVVHLHGELTKARSTVDGKLVYDIGYKEINLGDKCEKGSQMRPHIVWFGEEVPKLIDAVKELSNADYFIIIGTSLQVYPVASLIDYVPLSENLLDTIPVILIDPNEVEIDASNKLSLEVIKEKATVGVKQIVDRLLA